MPRTRAYRRHQRRRALARRYRILSWWTEPEERTPKALNWHINCSCSEEYTAGAYRRRADREWRHIEEVAW